MDKSDIAIETPAESSSAGMTLRALISAGIFGTIGGVIGKWLGARGNPSDNHMTERVMKWGMGIFSGLVAAYCSIKASEQRELTRLKPLHTEPLRSEAERVSRDVADEKIPLAMIQAEKEPQGKVQETSPSQQVEK